MSTPADLEIRRLPLTSLHPAAWNANHVPEKTLAKIRRSLQEFGVVENLVVRPHPDLAGGFEVLSGNHRLGLFGELGLKTAACHVLDLDDAHARLLAQTLNRTRGEDDPEAYAALLEDVLRAMPVADAVEFLPETSHSIDSVLGQFGSRRELVEPDVAPALPDTPASVPGEVYELGAHRLVCGDAADPEVLALLMRGEIAELMWTDPPYGVNYVGGTADALTLTNDDAAGLPALLRNCFGAVDSVLEPGGRFYVAAPGGPRGTDFRLAIADVGWVFHQSLVWAKDQFVLGHSDYHFQHEDILHGWKPEHEDVLYGWKPGAGRVGRGNHPGSRWYGGNACTSVFCVDRPRSSGEHPTMKPVALIGQHLRNSSRDGDVVLDPFAGSGSTLIAAEQEGRVARCVEIDPRYCDVIRARYERVKESGLVAA